MIVKLDKVNLPFVFLKIVFVYLHVQLLSIGSLGMVIQHKGQVRARNYGGNCPKILSTLISCYIENKKFQTEKIFTRDM